MSSQDERESNSVLQPPISDFRHDLFKMGDWLVDPLSNRIERQGELRPLRHKAMELLILLANNAGRVVSREEIIRDIWDGNDLVASKGIANTVWTLRQLLDDTAESPIYIETIAKRGYRLLAPVTPLSLPELSPSTSVNLAENLSIESIQYTPNPPSTAQSHNATDVASIPVGSRWRVGLFSAIAIVVVTVAAALWWFMAASAPSGRDVYTLPAGDSANVSVMQPTPERETVIALSPDSKKLAYVSRENLTANSIIRLRDLQQGNIVELMQIAGDIAGLAWSPDGSKLALLQISAIGECVVSTLTLSQLQLSPIADCASGQYRGALAWHAQHDSLIFSKFNEKKLSRIVEYQLKTQTVTELSVPAHEQNDYFSALSPNGREILFVRPSAFDQVQLFRRQSNGDVQLVWQGKHRYVSHVMHWWHDDNVVLAIGRTWTTQQIYNLHLPSSTLNSLGYAGVVPQRAGNGNVYFLKNSIETSISKIEWSRSDAPLERLTHLAQLSVFPTLADNHDVWFTSDVSGYLELYAVDVDGQITMKTHLQSGAWNAAPSPDGERVAFAGRCSGDDSEEVCQLERRTNTVSVLASLPEAVEHLAWFADGQAMVFTLVNGDVGILHWADRHITWLKELKAAIAYPGTKNTVYWTSLDKVGIWQRDLDTGKDRQIVADEIKARREWTVVGDDIYALRRPFDGGPLQLFCYRDGQTQLIHSLGQAAVNAGGGIAVDVDNKVLYVSEMIQQTSDVAVAVPAPQ